MEDLNKRVTELVKEMKLKYPSMTVEHVEYYHLGVQAGMLEILKSN